MAEDKKYVSGGPSFSALLTLLFIALKLTDHIDWPWVWVLAPIWGQLVLALLIILIGAVIYVIEGSQ